MLKRFSENELLGKPLSEEQQKELRALTEMPEEDIDTSDIPEVRELPAGAIRGRDFRPDAHVPIYLNPNVRSYLESAAKRKGVTLSSLVNDLLSKEIAIAETIK